MTRSSGTRVTIFDVVEAERRRDPAPGYHVTADTGATFDVTGKIDDALIVRGARTQVIGRVVRTGERRHRGDQVRVRIEFARDLGDVVGTLAFDYESVGGRAPHALFK